MTAHAHAQDRRLQILVPPYVLESTHALFEEFKSEFRSEHGITLAVQTTDGRVARIEGCGPYYSPRKNPSTVCIWVA